MVFANIPCHKTYSPPRVELVPPDALLGEFYGDLRQEFLDCLLVTSEWCTRMCCHGLLTGAEAESGVRCLPITTCTRVCRGDFLPGRRVNHAILNDARRADGHLGVTLATEGFGKTHGIDTLYLPNGVMWRL